MAQSHHMIEPFAGEQVRYVNEQRVISYGTSSYGYDVRCAREFKVFTNINSTIVDPKYFDERSFVDIEADECIIPPNSFALARTVEYFRIPRNVLVVCLGKSTYARCFSADTAVALSDGRAMTLEAMAEGHGRGDVFEGYTLHPDGEVSASPLMAPRYIGRDALLELTLDHGETIRCTPDHEFLRSDHSLTPAHALRPGDALMPIQRQVVVVRELPGDHDVYCLSVPDTHNFALKAGVFVRNCGIIVNVTPLEPEWEGHVTLEFSNTTPLPARIYANEGVAQMLFFESDQVCATSYKDRGGKYQGQRGVTLPKT